MEERPLERARRTAPEERPWERAGGREPVLRSGRRGMVALGGLFLLVLLPYQVVVRGVMEDQWVPATMEGGPAILHGFLVQRPPGSTSAQALAGVVAVLAVAVLVVSQRRARWARRWLADPLRRS